MVSKLIMRFNPIILTAVLNSSVLSRWSLLIAKLTLAEEITFYTHFHAALSFQPVLNPENVTRFVVTAPESIRLEGHELFMDVFYYPPQVSLLQPLLSRLSERGWAPQRIGGGPPPKVKIQSFDWQAPTQPACIKPGSHVQTVTEQMTSAIKEKGFDSRGTLTDQNTAVW